MLKNREFYNDGNSYQVDFDLAGLQSGVYYLTVEGENIQEVRKVIIY